MRVSNLLRSLDATIQDAAKIFGRINDNFDILRKILQNQVSLGDNIYCDIVTGQFDSGVPRACGLKNLKSAQGAIVVGSQAPCIASPLVSMSGSQATVTLFFAGMMKNVQATVILFDVGTVGTPYGSLVATVNAPGIVYPDGTTITVDNTGKLTGSGGGGGGPKTYDVDFSTLPTATLPTNSTVTVDGKTWTTKDFAGGAGSIFQLTNGTGLTITNTTNVAAIIHARLQDLIPGAIPLVNVTDLEIWYRYQVVQMGGSYSGVYPGIQSDDQSGSQFILWQGGPSTSGVHSYDAVYNNSDHTINGPANTIPDDVIVFRLLSDGSRFTVFTGTFNTGANTWPDPSSLVYRASLAGLQTPVSGAATGSAYVPVVGTTGPRMHVQTFGSPFTSAIYKRMLIKATLS